MSKKNASPQAKADDPSATTAVRELAVRALFSHLADAFDWKKCKRVTFMGTEIRTDTLTMREQVVALLAFARALPEIEQNFQSAMADAVELYPDIWADTGAGAHLSGTKQAVEIALSNMPIVAEILKLRYKSVGENDLDNHAREWCESLLIAARFIASSEGNFVGASYEASRRMPWWLVKRVYEPEKKARKGAAKSKRSTKSSGAKRGKKA